MCVFVSRPMKIVTFLLKNGEARKTGCRFSSERDTYRNKIMEIVEDFDEKSYKKQRKPWKSSRILHVKPNFFIFSLFIIFSCFLFIFFFFVNCSSFFFYFLFFLHLSSFFFSFSFSVLGCSKSVFFGLFKISCNISLFICFLSPLGV